MTNLIELYEDVFIFNDVHWNGLFYFAKSANGIPTINEFDKFEDMKFIEHDYEAEFHTELTNTYHELFKRVESLSTDWN